MLSSSPRFFRAATKPVVSIDLLTVNDIFNLSQVARQTKRETYPDAYTTEDLDIMYGESFRRDVESELSNNNIIYLVCRMNNEIVGYAKLVLLDDYAFLDKLYLLQKAQGIGLGKALLHHCYAIATNREYDCMRLNVYRDNQKAMDFYNKNGFTSTGQWRSYTNPASGKVYPDCSLLMECANVPAQLNKPTLRLV